MSTSFSVVVADDDAVFVGGTGDGRGVLLFTIVRTRILRVPTASVAVTTALPSVSGALYRME